MSQQLTLSFEPGLAERHKNLKACVRECVYRNPRPIKAIAADMDLSESDLTRKLGDNPQDPRKFSVCDLERFIRATGDVTPIHYLIEKFAVSAEAKQAFAAAELAKAIPHLLALARQLGANTETTKKGSR